MTISESVIDWLLKYDESVEGIDTDILSANTTSYALAKEPTINVKNYLSGRKEVTEYYQLTARLDSQTNADRKDNTAWLEGLEKWVSLQNKENNLPIIADGKMKEVHISSSFYLGQTQEDNALYQLTLAVKYTN